MGLAWDHDGRLFYGSVGPIWVCGAGGKLAAVTKLGESELAHTLPSLLPGDRVLLYTARKRLFTWGDEEIVAENLATGARKVVLVDAADARYLASGHLVFLRRGVLHAVAFDPERLEVRGPQVPVLDSVVQALSAQMANDVTGAGQFAVSSTGTLAYVAGSVVPPPDGRLIAVDRHGNVTTLPAPVKPYRGTVRLSPDGQRLTAHVWTLSEIGLWVYDLDRGTMPPLNREGEVDYAIWTPNAQQVVFKWRQHGRRSLASQSADGSTPPRTILQGNFDPASFTPDGRRLAAVAWAPSNVTSSIAIIDVDSGRILTEPSAERATASEIAPEFSRDGNRLAYVSNASGRNEVYVRPLQEPGGPVQVSLDGGDSPAWNPAGGELFFVGRPDPAGMRSMMAVDVAAGSTPRPGRPRPLFQFDPRLLGFVMTPTRAYDVALDGSRFYAIRTEPAVARPPVGYVNLITNWFEELKAKVPVKQ
jgi:serine/threonine-protein kinase